MNRIEKDSTPLWRRCTAKLGRFGRLYQGRQHQRRHHWYVLNRPLLDRTLAHRRLTLDCCLLCGGVCTAKVSEASRKMRNTIRFLLGNLFDFEGPLGWSELEEVDQYALHQLYQLRNEVTDHYERFEFHNGMCVRVCAVARKIRATPFTHIAMGMVVLNNSAFALLSSYASNELSSFYFELTKDRLYADRRDGPSRRAAQSVLFYVRASACRVTAQPGLLLVLTIPWLAGDR